MRYQVISAGDVEASQDCGMADRAAIFTSMKAGSGYGLVGQATKYPVFRRDL